MAQQLRGLEYALRHAQEFQVGEKRDLAWYLGFTAYGKGIKLGQNPFRVDCVEQWSLWREGWHHAANPRE
jgi:hypothetical protein